MQSHTVSLGALAASLSIMHPTSVGEYAYQLPANKAPNRANRLSQKQRRKRAKWSR